MVLRFLLYPFAVLYDVVTRVRNTLYDRGYKPSATFDLPVISVGNLSVGGTGKTPMTEYLIRLLSGKYKVASLSRGYGRKTRGIRIASPDDNPSTIGDEPYQLYQKFNDQIIVAVGEERVMAIPHILHYHEDVEVIVLDDAFQHRKVNPSFQLVLTAFDNLFYNDWLLPAGRLRESAKGITRADVIVVTKCPANITEEAMIGIEKSIRLYTNKPIFFSKIRYGNPVALLGHHPIDTKRVILVSGIANHRPLEQYISSNYTLVRHFAFADHYDYAMRDIAPICALARSENAMIITTEKDAVKLRTSTFKSVLSAVPCFYLPIEMEFLKNGKEFDETLLSIIGKY